MKTQREKLTPESIQKARQWFADNAQACIDEVKRGDVEVNYPDIYFEWCEQCSRDALAGRYDNTFAFWQKAYFIQTGECIAFFNE